MSLLAAALCFVGTSAAAATLQVGPGKPYAKPCAAFAAAQAGDTVEIDAAGNGTYDGDVCAFAKDGLTIRGVNGRARIDAAGKNAQGKAIWVIQGASNVVENVELSGCTVPDQNGAGIRQEGRNLTVRGCYFHDNENGILTGQDLQSDILIERSEFARNGAGDGYSHNMYIGHVGKFTLRGCYSHHAKIGHLVKSRAAINHILYNRLTDETGTASYELDLPNGGTSYVIGNVIQQGPDTDNSTLVSYRGEGGTADNPGTDLYVVNNTFVDQRSPAGKFLHIASTTAAILKNNIFVGAGPVSDQANSVLAGNLVGTDPKFVDASAYDYHLHASSPAVNAGADPGTGGGASLAPAFQYLHPANSEPRPADGTLDQGAFEYGQGAPVDAGAAPAPDAASPRADAQVAAGADAASASGADAGAGRDAGLPEVAKEGCGCSAATASPGSALVILAGGLLGIRGRRRR